MTNAALDIGGANIKGATDDGRALSLPFALWRSPEQLPDALTSVLERLAPFDRLAITMTGELCDCFEDQAHGVRSILNAVRRASVIQAVPEPRVWTLDRELVSIDVAETRTSRVAAANWLALAGWIARTEAPRDGVLLDMGTTTTDIVRFALGEARPRAFEDPLRLVHGELVYSGSRRTPLCALIRETRFRDQPCAIAAELFATSLDAWITIGVLPEDRDACDTADGRPATREAARSRLARSICADPASFSEADALVIAHDAARAQSAAVSRALAQVRPEGAPDIVVLSGSGEAVARTLLDRTWPGASTVSLAERHGADVSAAACAWALACLVGESASA